MHRDTPVTTMPITVTYTYINRVVHVSEYVQTRWCMFQGDAQTEWCMFEDGACFRVMFKQGFRVMFKQGGACFRVMFRQGGACFRVMFRQGGAYFKVVHVSV